MNKIVSRMAAVAALALAATPIIGLTAAHAAERQEPVARITVGDLRLSDPTDAKRFARRVDLAARDTCDAFGARGLAARACVADFKDEVKEALSEKQVAELRMANRAGAKVALAAN
ncbi:UrcA family protein [Caulobacter segnis]|uniref:UrcA family protein n=1 Tax=Caulobacter segnis TaxID=88688 RepID=UPI0028592BAA|nr:UrcA family protein [Caulobacter segnis]MDR6627139.1 UrcA family protein [Caulobacter segnis]